MKTEKESKIFLKVSSNKNFHILPFKKPIPTHQQPYVHIKFETAKMKKKRHYIISNLPEEFRQQSDKKTMFQCTFLVKKKCNKKLVKLNPV